MKKCIFLISVLTAVILVSCESQRELPKRYEPQKERKNKIDWENPVSGIYENIDTDPSRVDKLSQDSDGDGVSDLFDVAPFDASNKDVIDTTKRLIQYNAELRLTVKTPDSAIARCKRIAENYQGYAQTLSSHTAVIRVRAELLNSALTELAALGEVSYKNVFADDVTEHYYDYKTRLENLERARKRYLELLDKAANVQEALAVEKELERVNGEIDVLKGKISRLQHLVAYSTITIYVKEKVKPGPLGYVFVGLWKGIRWLFVRN